MVIRPLACISVDRCMCRTKTKINIFVLLTNGALCVRTNSCFHCCNLPSIQISHWLFWPKYHMWPKLQILKLIGQHSLHMILWNKCNGSVIMQNNGWKCLLLVLVTLLCATLQQLMLALRIRTLIIESNILYPWWPHQCTSNKLLPINKIWTNVSL